MTDAEVTNTIRNVAAAVNPNGSFIPGRYQNQGLWFNVPGPQIHYDYPRKRKGYIHAPTDTYFIKMAFLVQDRMDNVGLAEYPGAPVVAAEFNNRLQLLNQMDTLIDRFMMTLKELNGITIVGEVETEPAVLDNAGGLSGYIVSFTLSTTNGHCSSYELPTPARALKNLENVVIVNEEGQTISYDDELSPD